jgi:hypothetical protein
MDSSVSTITKAQMDLLLYYPMYSNNTGSKQSDAMSGAFSIAPLKVSMATVIGGSLHGSG